MKMEITGVLALETHLVEDINAIFHILIIVFLMK